MDAYSDLQNTGESNKFNNITKYKSLHTCRSFGAVCCVLGVIIIDLLYGEIVVIMYQYLLQKKKKETRVTSSLVQEQ